MKKLYLRRNKNHIHLFIFFCFIAFIIALLCFLNSSPNEAWCHEPEVFVVEGITSNELTERIKEYYYSNKDIWVWKKTIDGDYSLAIDHYSSGYDPYIFSGENVSILINNKIYSMTIPEAEVVRIEIMGICNSKEEIKNGEKFICMANSVGEVNRLNRTDENMLLLQEFENQFLKKLNINYLWEEPPLIDILFRKMYVFFH